MSDTEAPDTERVFSFARPETMGDTPAAAEQSTGGRDAADGEQGISESGADGTPHAMHGDSVSHGVDQEPTLQELEPSEQGDDNQQQIRSSSRASAVEANSSLQGANDNARAAAPTSSGSQADAGLPAISNHGEMGDSAANEAAAAAAAGNDAQAEQQTSLHAAAQDTQGYSAADDTLLDQALGNGSADRRRPDDSQFVPGMRAIDVEVDCGPNLPCKLLHVVIDVSPLQQTQKPYLGGFRHKHSGAVYHHAACQTPIDPKQRAVAAKGSKAGTVGYQKLTRETQTVKAVNTSSQTVREAATQMARPGLQLDSSRDRVLTPRPYTSSEAVGQQRCAAAQTIQRYCRGWLARLRATALWHIKAERDSFLANAATQHEEAAAADRKHEVERRIHPLEKSDFALLSSELEAWRQQQTAAIKAAKLDPREEQAALQLLLAKETRLLQTLDRLRVNAREEVKARKTEKELSSLSLPKTWTLTNGKKVLVHTPLTVRAAELQQLYRGLTLPNLILDERLDVLLHVKWAVKEFDCASTKELVDLIDREADLLNRGRNPKTLDGLRRRIAGAFLAFCQNPKFNPGAERLQIAHGPGNEAETFEYVDEIVQ